MKKISAPSFHRVFIAAFRIGILFAVTRAGAAVARSEKLTTSKALACHLVQNLCLVQASMNEITDLSMAVDTGSSLSVLNATRASELNLAPITTGSAAGPGADSSNVYNLYSGVNISVGQSRIENQNIISLPFNYVSERLGARTDGTLGSNLFYEHVVEIDYANSEFTIFSPLEWNSVSFGKAIPISIEDNVPFIQAAVELPDGSKISGKFIVDSGQLVSGLLLAEEFQNSHPTILRYGQLLHPPATAAVGGAIEFSFGRVPSVSFRGFTFVKPVAAFPIKASGIYARPGIAGGIGADLLSRFTVVFDYGKSQMFLMPNRRFGRPFKFDRTGIQLGARLPNYREVFVNGVLHDSPGELGDIRTGDIILKVNGVRAEKLTLADIQESFREAVGRYQLEIRRAGKTTVRIIHPRTLL